MHIEVVKEIKGYKYDEKRNISADKETYKYKYGYWNCNNKCIRENISNYSCNKVYWQSNHPKGFNKGKLP